MLFSPDLTRSQALMAMPHPLPGLSSQLQPPCSENKKANCSPWWGPSPPSSLWEEMRMSRLAWLLKAKLCGSFQLLVSYNCRNSADSRLYYCRTVTHVRMTRETDHITGERKGSCTYHTQHEAAQPSQRVTRQAQWSLPP